MIQWSNEHNILVNLNDCYSKRQILQIKKVIVSFLLYHVYMCYAEISHYAEHELYYSSSSSILFIKVPSIYIIWTGKIKKLIVMMASLSGLYGTDHFVTVCLISS